MLFVLLPLGSAALASDDIACTLTEDATPSAWFTHEPLGEKPVGSATRCVVFVSTPAEDGQVIRLRGKAGNVSDAVANALGQATFSLSPSALLRLDVVTRVWNAADYSHDPFNAGLWGIAKDDQLATALLPVEVNVRRLIDSRGRFRPSRIERYALNYDLKGTEDNWTLRFSVQSFARVDGQWHTLERGNRTPPALHPNLLRADAEQGAEYLARAVDDNGRYVYDLRPWLQGSDQSYNILRHAGTTFSLFEALRLLEPKPETAARWQAAGERALGYLFNQLRTCPGQPELRCLVEDDEIKIGGHGLALVAITEHAQLTGDDQHLPIAQELARWLVVNQREDGAFRPHKMYWSTGEADDFVSAYYPGEAILGLARLYRLDGNREWLETARRAADYLRAGRDRGKPEDDLPHDHWLLYGLVELQQLAPTSENHEHGLRIARAILRAQNRMPVYFGEPADWLGSFYNPPRSTPTATRAEALVSAWRLSLAGEQMLANTIVDALCRATGFMLRTRFLPEKALFTHEPARYVGGFHRSLTDYSVRIDYVQHNLSALLGLADILETRSNECLPQVLNPSLDY